MADLELHAGQSHCRWPYHVWMLQHRHECCHAVQCQSLVPVRTVSAASRGSEPPRRWMQRAGFTSGSSSQAWMWTTGPYGAPSLRQVYILLHNKSLVDAPALFRSRLSWTFMSILWGNQSQPHTASLLSIGGTQGAGLVVLWFQELGKSIRAPFAVLK